MTELSLRQLQKKLEKEKVETEWKLKEHRWRLDRTSAVSQCIVGNLYSDVEYVTGTVQSRRRKGITFDRIEPCKPDRDHLIIGGNGRKGFVISTT